VFVAAWPQALKRFTVAWAFADRHLKLDLPAVSKPTNTLVDAVRVGDLRDESGTG
jgi:hypothetical protein